MSKPNLPALALFASLGAAACGNAPPEPPPEPEPEAPALVDFVNWENAPIHGAELTPDRSRLLVVNTPDDRIEVFDVRGAVPVHEASIPVGLDPVSVRARSDNEIWVVNHISDSISVVDLAERKVIATLQTGDEPADVVFAGDPQRAFVSVSQENRLQIFDPANRNAAPSAVAIEGEDPRALATDGVNVFAAIFESGNLTTILGQPAVSNTASPYRGENPPPLLSDPFSPKDEPPAVGLIVKRAADGSWRDENQSDWDALVPWDLHDHDVAILSAADPGNVRYATGIMNLNMGIALRHDGSLAVVGSDATNEIRFEPRVKSTFARMVLGSVEPVQATSAHVDLNPHLDYQRTSISADQRQLSLSDPRAVVWSATRDLGFVAGMGSNNVAALNAAGERLATISVGQGPAALALDESANRLYVLNRFDASVSVVDITTNAVQNTTRFFDPTPDAIRAGRPFLYESTRFSGLGQASCASCHIDARMDQLAWDLGDPEGELKVVNQRCDNGPCPPWHPMKGPMTTQTLQGIVGSEPLHWRGDREDLAAFGGAFVSLLGADEIPAAKDLQAFEDFVTTITFPPNPNRNLDGSTKDEVFPNGGNPRTGENLFHNGFLDGGLQCSDCHSGNTGTNGFVNSFIALQETQNFKVAQLRNLYEKTGFDKTSTNNNRGFGFLHDGSDDKLAEEFFERGPFTFAPGAQGQQQRRDIEAFMMSFGIDTHPSVGKQLTFTAAEVTSDEALAAQAFFFFSLANAEAVGVVAKLNIDGQARGFVYDGKTGLLRSDRANEPGLTPDEFVALIVSEPVTMTVVPFGTQNRIGVDRDADGALDQDERDAGTDPNNPDE